MIFSRIGLQNSARFVCTNLNPVYFNRYCRNPFFICIHSVIFFLKEYARARREYEAMKKRSTYEINGDIYEFNNERLKKIIWNRNPNRGAYEKFYRMVVNQNVGIAYDTVKGWVKNNTNPALEDVKTLAKILEIPYMDLLVPTHYGADAVHTRLQKIRFTEVLDPFSLSYCGFSNVLDMIFGMGYNPVTEKYYDSDFAEKIINSI